MILAAPVHADEFADISRLMQGAQYAPALAKADAWLAQKPRDPQMRFTKGVILTEMNRTQDAIAVFTRLSEDYPNLPEPYNNLAVLYAGQGQFEKARAALDKAIRTNPSYATAYENLGDVHARLASQAYDKALQIDSGNAGTKSKLTLVRSMTAGVQPPVRLADNTPVQKALPAPPAAAVAARPATPAPPAMPAQAPVRPPVVAAPAPSRPAVVAAAPVAPAAPPQTALPPAVRQKAPEVKVAAAAAAAAVAAAAAPAKAAVPAPVAMPPLAKADPAPEPKAKQQKTSRAEVVERDAVLAAVGGWAKAWSARDVKGYLNHYAADFDTPGNQSRKAWADDRQARIVGKGRISVRVESPQVTVQNDRATVKFRQVYTSDRLSANSRKTLVLVKQRGKWVIQKETTGS